MPPLCGVPNTGAPALFRSISLARSESDSWSVSYRLPSKTSRIGFVRNPDDSRVLRWVPKDKEFEIVQIDGSEFIRRKDGRGFDSVEIQLTPKYKHLPKDYGPFSPFSDGGLLIHTGRYFACAITCEDEEFQWQFTLTDERSGFIIVDGEQHEGRASWIDSGSGTNVYVGNNVQPGTSGAWVIIDPAFPTQVVEMLNTNLPTMMAYFSDKLGELPENPSIYASYDAEHANGSGRQGGTLPNQMFMHFYGDSLEKQLIEPNFDLWLSWFFARETAHLHSTGSGQRESWIHEGAADALAAIVIRDWSDRARKYVVTRQQDAYESCLDGLQSKTLESAADAGDFQLYYSCGLLLHIALDQAIRKENPRNDGLFALWRAYEAEIASGSNPDGMTFRRVVTEFLGSAVADWVEQFTPEPMPDFKPWIARPE